MGALNTDYTGCSVFIYDEEGKHLCNTIVTHHNRKMLRIEVEEPPQSLEAGDACRLLILTSPTPCEYLGRIAHLGKTKPIAIYRGQEHEKRGEQRFSVSIPAYVENYICDDNIYPMHCHLGAEIINISKNGTRFRTPYYAMTVGDRFKMRFEANDRYKLIFADVMNLTNQDTKTSEYGCRILICDDGGAVYG